MMMYLELKAFAHFFDILREISNV